jgi:NifU-like protein involved in Fe-S cluster formation
MDLPDGPDGSLAGHFFAPRNAGSLEPPRRVGRAENAACGDVLELHLRVEAERLAAARFQARGCSALIASASLVTQAVQGLTLAEARGLDLAGLVAAAGGLPPRGQHALAVVARALEQALGAQDEGGTT